MKRFVFAFMTMLLTFTVAGARDVGIPLQTDVGCTYMVPTQQHSDLIPAFADVTFETIQVVQVRAVGLGIYNQKVVRLSGPPVYRNPDYGLCRYNYSIAGLSANTHKNTALPKQIPK
jgi:hypothetical protein